MGRLLKWRRNIKAYIHCKNVMVISTLSGLSQLHPFRGFHITPHHAALSGLKWPLYTSCLGCLSCICSEVSIVAHTMQCISSEVSIVTYIMQLVFSGPLNFLSWLSQLHLFSGFHSSPHNAVHPFRGFYSSPHHAAIYYMVAWPIPSISGAHAHYAYNSTPHIACV